MWQVSAAAGTGLLLLQKQPARTACCCICCTYPAKTAAGTLGWVQWQAASRLTIKVGLLPLGRLLLAPGADVAPVRVGQLLVAAPAGPWLRRLVPLHLAPVPLLL